jgi:hypothetical protein
VSGNMVVILCILGLIEYYTQATSSPQHTFLIKSTPSNIKARFVETTWPGVGEAEAHFKRGSIKGHLFN